jgi:hypothetical protein
MSLSSTAACDDDSVGSNSDHYTLSAKNLQMISGSRKEMSSSMENPMDMGRVTMDEMEKKSWVHMDSVHSRASTINSMQPVARGLATGAANAPLPSQLLAVTGSASFQDSIGSFNDSCVSFASFGGSDSDFNGSGECVDTSTFTQLAEQEERSARAEDVDAAHVSLSILGLEDDEEEDEDDDLKQSGLRLPGSLVGLKTGTSSSLNGGRRSDMSRSLSTRSGYRVSLASLVEEE